MSQNTKMWALGAFMFVVGVASAYPYGHLEGKKAMYVETKAIRDMLDKCFADHTSTIRRELQQESRPEWLERALLKAVLGF